MKVLLLTLSLLLLSCSAKKGDTQEEWRYLYDLGMSSFYAKNYSEAIAYLYRASRVAPGEPKIWNALGVTYMEVEEFGKAEEAFKRVLKLDPDYSEAKMNLGILYFKMKDYRKAISYLKDAVADEMFDKKHIALYHLAKVYKEIGDGESYMEYLRKATAYNPLFLEAQLELGSAYMDAKRYEEAERLYKTLVSNNFRNPEVYLSLAKVYYETGHLDKAKEAVKMVIEDRQASNLQRTQAYEILSRILVEEQRRTLRGRFPHSHREEGKFGIQIAAFSTRSRAETLIEELEKKGLRNLTVIEASGIYKVIYGRFLTRREAQRELERLKDHDIYGFIVEVE